MAGSDPNGGRVPDVRFLGGFQEVATILNCLSSSENINQKKEADEGSSSVAASRHNIAKKHLGNTSQLAASDSKKNIFLLSEDNFNKPDFSPSTGDFNEKEPRVFTNNIKSSSSLLKGGSLTRSSRGGRSNADRVFAVPNNSFKDDFCVIYPPSEFGPRSVTAFETPSFAKSQH